VAIGLFPQDSEAVIKRSQAAKLEFRLSQPCPGTGLYRGRCDGYQVDHVQPLCSGGADTPANMQWLSVSEHKTKTRKDVRVCRYLRMIK
jgi:hypothetical protein